MERTCVSFSYSRWIKDTPYFFLIRCSKHQQHEVSNCIRLAFRVKWGAEHTRNSSIVIYLMLVGCVHRNHKGQSPCLRHNSNNRWYRIPTSAKLRRISSKASRCGTIVRFIGTCAHADLCLPFRSLWQSNCACRQPWILQFAHAWGAMSSTTSYANSLLQTEQCIRKVCSKRPNLFFLQKSSIIVTENGSSVRFLGATLYDANLQSTWRVIIMYISQVVTHSWET